MMRQQESEVPKTTGYILGIGQVIQLLSFPLLVMGQFLLQTDDLSLVIASAALVLAVGNFVVLYQLQQALFENGTTEWMSWVS
ncbi:hypothetical protein HALLA_20335 (plasmid) [Halostagnicola larsenii XH-48]|uniref:Uncharacterized protein n=1 Tax=Halostagnicola larsenii XH-48 TaxID=797299 RepID=W0JYA7_9EURY|nr:hypothetical protein [Halostagnicola larsenii]AHG02252.1 hypothetical protein HALLA_20335 [Halostagnicola larsenii XH-48]